MPYYSWLLHIYISHSLTIWFLLIVFIYTIYKHQRCAAISTGRSPMYLATKEKKGPALAPVNRGNNFLRDQSHVF
jgi:hypothetical protein